MTKSPHSGSLDSAHSELFGDNSPNSTMVSFQGGVYDPSVSTNYLTSPSRIAYHLDGVLHTEASTVAFSAAVALHMYTANAKLNADISAFGSSPNQQQFQTLQQDVVQYYQVQVQERGYAGLAASVAGNSDFNGNVAVNNIEEFYGDKSFGMNELKVAERLANQDYATVTQNGTLQPQNGQTVFVPDITDDVAEHVQVFGELSIPLRFWSATDFALNNINWMGTNALPADLQSVSSQSGALPPQTPIQQALSAANLSLAVLDSEAQNFFNPGSYIPEELQDVKTFGSLLGAYASTGAQNMMSAMQKYGITFINVGSNTGMVSFDATAIDTSQNSTTLTQDGLSGGTFDLNAGALMKETLDGTSGTSVVRLVNPDASTYLEVQNFDQSNGSGVQQDNVLFETSGTTLANIYTNGPALGISNAVVNLDSAGVTLALTGSYNSFSTTFNNTLSVSGVGNTFSGTANDQISLLSGAGLTVSSSGGTFNLNGSGAALVDTSSGATIAVNSFSDYLSASNVAVSLNSTGSNSLVGSYLAVTDTAANSLFISGGAGDTFKGLASDITSLGSNTGLTVSSSGGTYDLNSAGAALVDSSSGGSVYMFAANDYLGGSNQSLFLNSAGSESAVGSYLSISDYAAGTLFLSGGAGNTFKGIASDVVSLGANTGLTVGSSGGTYDMNGAGAALVDSSSGGSVYMYANNDYLSASSQSVFLDSAGSERAALPAMPGASQRAPSPNALDTARWSLPVTTATEPSAAAESPKPGAAPGLPSAFYSASENSLSVSAKIADASSAPCSPA